MADPRSGHFGGLYELLTGANNRNGAAIVEMAMAEGGVGLFHVRDPAVARRWPRGTRTGTTWF